MILVTGASGYVGGHLARRLADAGAPVRCLARRPDLLRGQVPASAEIVAGDLLRPETLVSAFAGVQTAYYLVHSLGSGADFEASEELCARHFVAAAKAAGVRRVIYLGGLGDSAESLSPHLRSRQRVGEILRGSLSGVTEFRASIVLGFGSLSFEMIRALVERLPVLVLPRWVTALAQPIAIEDLLAYLRAPLNEPLDSGNRVFEIGGAGRTSYEGLMREYARQRGLTRWMIRVPVLTPRLSSLWLALVTPLLASVGRQLIESIRHATVVRDNSAESVFRVRSRGYAEAITAALESEDADMAGRRWSGGTFSGRRGNYVIDSRTHSVPVARHLAFRPVLRVGGAHGWYYGNWLWTIRGLLDRLLGGPGMRRSSRRPGALGVGNIVDCWRVEAFDPGGLLRLKAEMKLPGRAWLQFEVQDRDGGSILSQTALFDARGVLGRAYWWVLYPVHMMMFEGMLSGMADAAMKERE
jgi:uncharacterized protein YbjT (DUF2867 family)